MITLASQARPSRLPFDDLPLTQYFLIRKIIGTHAVLSIFILLCSENAIAEKLQFGTCSDL